MYSHTWYLYSTSTHVPDDNSVFIQTVARLRADYHLYVTIDSSFAF